MKNKIRLLITILFTSVLLVSCGNSNNSSSSQKKVSTKTSDTKKAATKVKDSTLSNAVPKDEVDSSLNNSVIPWYFMPNTNKITPDINPVAKPMLKKYNGYYVGDTSSKVIYLTFDEGYENGYTSKILDTLKSNNVQASFFVTTPYIKSEKDLIKRMVNEGHVVGNHSTTHPSMPSITNKEKFDNELVTAAKTFEEVTGKKMSPFFRPPMGQFSERSMYYTSKLGYNTIFWSFAYADWDPQKQPDPVKSKETILSHAHNGAIMLLHAVSKTNTEILDSVIKELKNQGYVFKSLNELPKIN